MYSYKIWISQSLNRTVNVRICLKIPYTYHKTECFHTYTIFPPNHKNKSENSEQPTNEFSTNCYAEKSLVSNRKSAEKQSLTNSPSVSNNNEPSYVPFFTSFNHTFLIINRELCVERGYASIRRTVGSISANEAVVVKWVISGMCVEGVTEIKKLELAGLSWYIFV